MIKRYTLEGNTQLAKDEQRIIDLTNMPQNLAETLNVIKQAEQIWDNQGSDVKLKFNNDFNQFLAGAENGKLTQILQNQLNTQATKFNPQMQSNMTEIQKSNIIAKQQEIIKAQKELEEMQVLPNQTKIETEGGEE